MAAEAATELARAEAFYAAHTAPGDVSAVRELAAEFAGSVAEGERAVLVTSGGTKVALERNSVRFLDNFSTGTRGAASVEHFLDAGYRVLFLRRRGSVFPFERHLRAGPGAAPLLDAASVEADGVVTVRAEDRERRRAAAKAVRAYRKHTGQGRLRVVEFDTLIEYLFYLRQCAEALAPLGSRAMLYFAAAVSDFYVPEHDMATHKIQSAGGPMTLQLQQVPKLLGCVRRHWAPRAFCVSFKLETDRDILMRKAEGAMAAYGMDAVVANELATRQREATVLVRARRAGGGDGDGGDDGTIRRVRVSVDDVPDHFRGGRTPELEELLVRTLRGLQG